METRTVEITLIIGEIIKKRTIELTLDKAREWYNNGGELKEIALQAFSEKELKTLTYEDICKELFLYKKTYYINSNGDIEYCISHNCNMLAPNSSTSARQLEKLSAINKLVNVAKFLNEGWEPDWSNPREEKWYIAYYHRAGEIAFDYVTEVSESCVYFKSKELALKAIEILGEETVKLAIASNW